MRESIVNVNSNAFLILSEKAVDENKKLFQEFVQKLTFFPLINNVLVKIRAILHQRARENV